MYSFPSSQHYIILNYNTTIVNITQQYTTSLGYTTLLYTLHYFKYFNAI